MVKHTLKPIYDVHSKILILGSMPSVKSREIGMYYAHPQNRFWKVLEGLFNTKIINKVDFLLKHNIALWDVISSCDIKGSSDSSIKNVVFNDVNYIIKNSNIKYIFCTGKTAYKLYNKYLYELIRIDAIYLPSPSPANAKISLEDLIDSYKIVKIKLEEE